MMDLLRVPHWAAAMCIFTAAASAQPPVEQRAKNWHHWRGPEADGVSRTASPPIEWSESKNVRWKVAVDGMGTSTPIVWGNDVFLLTAIDTGTVDPSLPKPEDQPKRVFGITHPNTKYEFVVVCLNRQTGKERWRRVARRGIPHEGTHGDNDFASASPTTDGRRLYCWFGSMGLHCYDLWGEKLWERDLGRAHVGASLGEGCSPVVHADKLIVVRDHSRQSSIEVLNTSNGETLWRKNRDEPNAWATPRVVDRNGRTQVITAASNFVRSYDLETGEIIWQCNGLTGNVTPCPVVDRDSVYVMSGYRGFAVMALPLDAEGDISGTDAIRWRRDRATPYVPSPVLSNDRLWFLQSNQAILSVVNTRNGEMTIDRTRLPGLSNVYASPVAAGGHVYVVGRNGATAVLKQGDELEIVATNELDERFDSSPAVAGNQLFLRGAKYLYCLEGPGDAE